MSVFWNLWAVALTVIFFIAMVSVVIKYWRSNHNANANKTIETFDGVKENDAPVPKFLFWCYLIAFSLSFGHLLLYPGLGNWPGLLNWKQSSDKLSSPSTTLSAQVSALTPASLSELAQNPQLVSSGKTLFQTHCAACHRSNAQGQKNFPNLIDNDWLYGDTDKDILHSIKHGRNGAMPGWQGILTNEQIQNLSYYVVSINERVTGVPAIKRQLGKESFLQYCSACHGDGRQSYPIRGVPNLSNSIWLHGGSMEDIQQTIRLGLNSVMPEFASKLSEAEILSVGAYITHQRINRNQRIAALDKKSVARGQYLAQAGDCIACHSAVGGEAFAGGLPFVTPFGTIYSTNITPHISEGIGSYDFAEFKDALVHGKGKNGYLYPAMPYTSYQHVTEEDLKALWDYLRSIIAVPRRNDPNHMIFPSNIRLGLLSWNLIFMETDPLDYNVPEPLRATVKDVDKWQRGKYWASSFGHCSECHTPRNIAQALESDKMYQGNLIDGWNAPAINANELYTDGWDLTSLTDFLHTGRSSKGTAFAGMADVVKNSLRHMSRDDIESISYYLLNGDEGNYIEPDAQQLSPSGFTPSALQTEEYRLFSDTCGACHGADGKGRQDIAPTLLHNGIIMHSDPFNTIAVTIRGLSPSYVDEKRNFMPMASFAEILSDQELAKLITFVRFYLGDRKQVVTGEDIRSVRLQLERAGFTGGLHTTPDMYSHRDKNIHVD
ncbi:c-type cytochrome [Vibrio profundum]|uniref:c-type cytochrome n=1 Tax=Vibrio profundum TaxID=2910247 RepID=UPI003D09DC39